MTYLYKSGRTVKEVYLIGVDMFGRLYFDGTKNLSLKKEEKTWDDCDNMNRMIRLCEGGGMTVKSLSETKLEVERV